MDNPVNPQGLGIQYTSDDKEFLAAFYSQAVHNVFIVFCHISKRLGLAEPEEDGKLTEWMNQQLIRVEKSKNVSAINKQRFLEMIDQHFPFLRIIGAGKKGTDAENDLLKNANLLVSLLGQLRDYRNANSHAKYFPKKEMEAEQLVNQLYSVYDANINLVKRDFFESNVRIDIRQADLYESDFNHLRRFTKNTDKSPQNKKDKNVKSGPNPKFKYHFQDSETHRLSTYGHVFFASLFLEKKYSILMQKWVPGLKNASESWHRMTNEVFSRTRIQLPRVRLHSTKTADALVLDMLNELAKAPVEFYDQLHESVKHKFIIDSSDREEEDEGILNPEVKAIRKQNRFAYFALRYFDEVNAFEKMRFQIDLGHYHFHLYRSVINGQDESRHLVKRLFGFGKLNDYDQNLAPEYWKEKNKDLDYYEDATEPFVTKTYPHYHLEENKIGIRFLTNPNQAKWPGLDVSEHPSYPKYHREEDKSDIAEAFLSANELLPMAFCHYLYTMGGEVVEPFRGIIDPV